MPKRNKLAKWSPTIATTIEMQAIKKSFTWLFKEISKKCPKMFLFFLSWTVCIWAAKACKCFLKHLKKENQLWNKDNMYMKSKTSNLKPNTKVSFYVLRIWDYVHYERIVLWLLPICNIKNIHSRQLHDSKKLIKRLNRFSDLDLTYLTLFC